MNKAGFLPRFFFSHVLLLCLVLMLSGCSATSPTTVARPSWQPEHPQDMTAFSRVLNGSMPLLSAQEQMDLDLRANQRLFAPWRQTRTGVTAATVAPFSIAEGVITPKGFAENLQPWDEAHWRALALNCNAGAFPSLAPQGIVTGQIGDGNPNSGIITQNTALRVLPTLRPMFTNPDKAGQGYPFDMLQNSAIWLGTPVFVSHSSADGAWLYCEASYASGWVPAQHVAFADPEFRARYERGRYVAIVRDSTPLRDYSGYFLSLAHIGTVLPLARWVPGEPVSVLVPLRDPAGRATTEEAPLEENAGAVKPLPLTADAVATIGNRMMGQLYGWGGMYEDRDCSATLRDLFAAFGIWLPRNSAAQGKTGKVISLDKLSRGAKEQIIRDKAIPFRTLIWMPGHIGLYVGQWQGKAAMYHTLWGLRTLEGGKEGRLVLGKTLISALDPGADIPQVQSILLDRVGAIAILGATE